MTIPKKFKVSNRSRAYTVVRVPTLRNGRELARVFFDERVVKVARSAVGKRLTRRQVQYAFWHEVTHAILHDMRHPLHTNEGFVVRFSDRLENVMASLIDRGKTGFKMQNSHFDSAFFDRWQ